MIYLSWSCFDQVATVFDVFKLLLRRSRAQENYSTLSRAHQSLSFKQVSQPWILNHLQETHDRLSGPTPSTELFDNDNDNDNDLSGDDHGDDHRRRWRHRLFDFTGTSCAQTAILTNSQPPADETSS